MSEQARVPIRRTNLRGHALRSEGKAYGLNGEPDGPLVRYRGHIGQGLCECGAVSEVAWSDAARKRWHAQHKDEIRATSSSVITSGGRAC